MKEGKPNPKERDSGYRYKEGKNISVDPHLGLSHFFSICFCRSRF